MELFGPLFEPRPEDTGDVAELVGAIRARHRNRVIAILVYGSCLRTGDIHDGLLDLYVVVDSYRHAHRNPLAAAANWLLPPNVYYLQTSEAARPLRCKYAVLDRRDLERGCRDWFESYLWGRFCQPMAILFAANDDILAQMRERMRDAVATFLDRALPLAPPAGRIETIWAAGLRQSYMTELRAERGNRAELIVDYAARHYVELTAAVAGKLRDELLIEGEQYLCEIPAVQRWLCRLGWRLRALGGKGLSVLRLLKALFTFDGGLDYIAWKLSRHSGKTVEIPPLVRRYPLLFVWGFMFRLYREGIFR